MCQDFLRHLSSLINPKELSALSPQASLTIVGCGEPQLIEDYISKSQCAFPVYADPSRRLYDLLGMTSTLAAGSKPEYQTTPFMGVVAKGVYQTLGAGSQIFKGGSFNQVGGDFLFQDGAPVWCHRMRNTRDHTGIPQIRKRLGL